MHWTNIAARTFTLLSAVAGLFQLALAAGLPWGQLAYGGAFPGVLPPHMRLAAVGAAMVIALFCAIVLARADMLRTRWRRASDKLVWLVVAYCAVGVVANASTPSDWERVIWLPVTLVLLVSATIVARSRGSRP